MGSAEIGLRYQHVLNLAIKALLWGANVEAFERDNRGQANCDAADAVAELVRWFDTLKGDGKQFHWGPAQES
jgi:hypothetical protein